MPFYRMAHQDPDPTLFPLQHDDVTEILKRDNHHILRSLPLNALEMTRLSVGGDIHEDEAGILQNPSLFNKKRVQVEGMVKAICVD